MIDYFTFDTSKIVTEGSVYNYTFWYCSRWL